MAILVTGAAGFIGSHTVDALLRRGERVVGVDNFRTGSPAHLDEARRSAAFEFVEGDVTDEPFMAGLLVRDRFAAVVHLAGLVGVAESLRHPRDNRRLNVDATAIVARAAIRGGCRRLVFASSAAVYGAPERLPLDEESPCRPISPYGDAKLESEQLLDACRREHGLDAVSLRYFNVYGPRQDPASEYSGVISRFDVQLRSGRPLAVHGDGLQTRDFVFVGDVAEVNAEAALRGAPLRPIYNVCTGVAMTIMDLIRELGRLRGVSPEVRHGAPREGDIRHSRGSPVRLVADGLAPELTGLREGLLAGMVAPDGSRPKRRSAPE